MMTLAVILAHDYVPVLSKFGAMNLYKQRKYVFFFFFPKNEIEFSLFKKDIQYGWCHLPVVVTLIRNSNSKYFIIQRKVILWIGILFTISKLNNPKTVTRVREGTWA